MRIIDDRGYLFGLVNIIDALVVLALAAVLIVGVALVTGSGGAPADADTEVIVFQTDTYPEYVTDAIKEGQIGSEDVVAVLEKSVTDLPANESQPGVTTTRARLRVEVVVGTSPGGLATFKGERLYIGRQLRLDLETTIVEGRVVAVAA